MRTESLRTAVEPRPVEQAGVTGRTRELLWVLGLALVIILLRLPFRATLLSTFDSINYALALERFDIRLSQPQAPGYPLYILLGRAFNLVFQDHLAALVWLSIVFGALAVVAMYLAGRDMFGYPAGAATALLAGTSTVGWYMAEIAAPYTADFFASAIVGWLCYRNLTQPSTRWSWLSATALGLAGGLRPQTLIFLLPLFLYALLGKEEHKAARKRYFLIIGITLLVAGLLLAIFLIPAVVISGGLAAFHRALVYILPIFRDVETFSRSIRLDRFFLNAVTVATYIFRTLGELALPFLATGLFAQKPLFRFWRNRKLVFLFLWIFPTFCVYFLIWPGNIGTILVMMPPFFLLAGAGFGWLYQRAGLGRRLAQISLTAVLAWSLLVFAVLPREPFGPAYRTFENYASLEAQITYYQSKLDLVSQFPVEGSLVFTDDFRHMQYYLPQYHTFSIPYFDQQDPQRLKQIVSLENGEMKAWKGVGGSELVAPGTRRLIFFDFPQWLAVDEQLDVREYTANGYSITVVNIPEDRSVIWSAYGIFLQPVSGGE